MFFDVPGRDPEPLDNSLPRKKVEVIHGVQHKDSPSQTSCSRGHASLPEGAKTWRSQAHMALLPDSKKHSHVHWFWIWHICCAWWMSRWRNVLSILTILEPSVAQPLKHTASGFVLSGSVWLCLAVNVPFSVGSSDHLAANKVLQGPPPVTRNAAKARTQRLGWEMAQQVQLGDFEMGRTLGCGSFGRVKFAKYKPDARC